MGLTQQQRLLQCRDSTKFPAAQLFVLALIRAAEPIALTSIFPYAWKLCLHYGIGENDAAFYAGILIAAFSLSEALTGMFWGSISDRIGRKPVLLMGNAGTLLALLILGLAPNFWVGLAGRILGGLLNGNIAVIQTMVGELVTNPKHEPKAFAVMPFVWSIGTIIGPSIGGYFAEPVENFPSLFPRGGIFDSNPYLLPNLVCASLLLLSIIAGYFFLSETHPDMQPWSTREDLDYTSAATPLIPATGAVNNAAADLTTESYGTFAAVEIVDEYGQNIHDKSILRSNSETSMSSIRSVSGQKVFTRQVIQLTVALGIYTYHSMAYDHLMPIFFQDARWLPAGNSMFDVNTNNLAGGLGLSTQQVGIIMSFNGLIALFVQGLVFPTMASWFGVWKLFVIVTVGHPIAYFVMPYLVLLPERHVYVGIYTCLLMRNFFSILAYPLLLILIKEAAPSSSHLGKINGLAASTGGACRTIASPLSGLLYGIGSSRDFTALAWWASCLIAVVGALQVPWIGRTKNKTAHVHAATDWAHDTTVESDDRRRERQPLPRQMEERSGEV